MSDEPQPIPIEAYFVGDHITHLVVILSTDTIDETCAKVADMMVGRRIAPRSNATYVLSVGGKVVPGHLNVSNSPVTPFGNVTVDFAS